MKHLIPPSYKRAALLEKLVGVLFFVAWITANILTYKYFKN
jgi:hypothetical protein